MSTKLLILNAKNNCNLKNTCGSMTNGHRSEFVRIIAFSVDILSDGNPSLFHCAIVASSVSRFIGFKPSVVGIAG